MAHTVSFFHLEDDERAFIRNLARHKFEVYPRRVPPDWTPFRISDSTLPSDLPEDDLYLAAYDLAPVLVDKVKRGPDKGFWRVDEVKSPVIYYERCRFNDDGELLSGKLWAELDVTAQTGRKDPAPDKFRRLYLEIDEWMKKVYRKGDLKGYFVGPATARKHKQGGLVLRINEHLGGTVAPYK